MICKHIFRYTVNFAQSAGILEYSDYFSAED